MEILYVVASFFLQKCSKKGVEAFTEMDKKEGVDSRKGSSKFFAHYTFSAPSIMWDFLDLT